MTRLLKRKFHINTLMFVKGQQGWLSNIQYWNCLKDAVWGSVGNVHSYILVITLPVLVSRPESAEDWFVIQLSRVPKRMPAPRFSNTRPNWWGHGIPRDRSRPAFQRVLRPRRHLLPLAKKTGRGYHMSLGLISNFRREISNLFSGGMFSKGPSSIWSQRVHVDLWFACVCVLLVCADTRLGECT